MPLLSRPQVLELAPDAGSAKAGAGLARPGQWGLLGQADGVVWGEIRGSGKNPYQVRVDFDAPAFKCSCPSRKFPCKHALGLLLILAEDAAQVPKSPPPAWVTDWLQEREARREKRESKVASTTPPDEKAQAARAAKRAKKVAAGVDELTLWLADLARQGLARAQVQPDRFWEAASARMIDAQAPGLARLVRRLRGLVSSGSGWQSTTLAAMGQLHLLLHAYRRLDALPRPLQADVRAAVGWPAPNEELARQPIVRDDWLIAGQVLEHEEQLRIQRTWLLGRRSDRPAMILQFAAGAQPFEHAFTVGQAFAGALAYYPSAAPLRAAVLERGPALPNDPTLPRAVSIPDALSAYGAALAMQPWLERWPMTLHAVRAVPPEREYEGWRLSDADARLLGLRVNVDVGWQLAAVSAAGGCEIFGEWDGAHFAPQSAASAGRFYALTPYGEARRLARVA